MGSDARIGTPVYGLGLGVGSVGEMLTIPNDPKRRMGTVGDGGCFELSSSLALVAGTMLPFPLPAGTASCVLWHRVMEHSKQ